MVLELLKHFDITILELLNKMHYKRFNGFRVTETIFAQDPNLRYASCSRLATYQSA
jgi:hypothetical protein